MASTLFLTHAGRVPSPRTNYPASSPSRTGSSPSHIQTTKQITRYGCGHSTTSQIMTAPPSSHWTSRFFKSIPSIQDRGNCPACIARLEYELQNAAYIQSKIQQSAMRASWIEGRQNPAPPTQGTAAIIRLLARKNDVADLDLLTISVEQQQLDPWALQREMGSRAQTLLDSVTTMPTPSSTQRSSATVHDPLLEQEINPFASRDITDTSLFTPRDITGMGLFTPRDITIVGPSPTPTISSSCSILSPSPTSIPLQISWLNSPILTLELTSPAISSFSDELELTISVSLPPLPIIPSFSDIHELATLVSLPPSPILPSFSDIGEIATRVSLPPSLTLQSFSDIYEIATLVSLPPSPIFTSFSDIFELATTVSLPPSPTLSSRSSSPADNEEVYDSSDASSNCSSDDSDASRIHVSFAASPPRNNSYNTYSPISPSPQFTPFLRPSDAAYGPTIERIYAYFSLPSTFPPTLFEKYLDRTLGTTFPFRTLRYSEYYAEDDPHRLPQHIVRSPADISVLLEIDQLVYTIDWDFVPPSSSPQSLSTCSPSRSSSSQEDVEVENILIGCEDEEDGDDIDEMWNEMLRENGNEEVIVGVVMVEEVIYTDDDEALEAMSPIILTHPNI